MSTLPRLDIARLDAYLSTHIPSFHGLQTTEKFSGGQSNPTYRLGATSGDYVLRRKPPGTLLKSAHAVDREYRVMQALADSAVPVPEVFHLCTDESIIGSMFFVMSYVPGRIFWNPALPELPPDHRAGVYSSMHTVLSALHSVNPASIGLQDYGRSGNYYSRQIARWTKQYKASETESIPAMNTLAGWLPDNLPPEDGQVCLIHGDFRMDNMIFDTAGTHVLALLDWELSTLGHPFADLAYQCMQWRMPADSVLAGLGNLDRRALGLPTEEEYVQAYCTQRGLGTIPDWNFYLAFSFFRFAAILQGVRKRALDGNASSDKAMAYGAMTPVLAEMAMELL